MPHPLEEQTRDRLDRIEEDLRRIIANQPRDTKSTAQWTVWKEVVGTFVGVAPFIVGLVIWGATLEQRVRVIESRLELRAEQLREERLEVKARLERLSTQVEELRLLVAKGK